MKKNKKKEPTMADWANTVVKELQKKFNPTNKKVDKAVKAAE